MLTNLSLAADHSLGVGTTIDSDTDVVMATILSDVVYPVPKCPHVLILLYLLCDLIS